MYDTCDFSDCSAVNAAGDGRRGRTQKRVRNADVATLQKHARQRIDM